MAVNATYATKRQHRRQKSDISLNIIVGNVNNKKEEMWESVSTEANDHALLLDLSHTHTHKIYIFIYPHLIKLLQH